MDVEVLNRFVALERRRRELKDSLSQVEEELKPVKEAVAREFQREGTQHWKSTDGPTVYLKRMLVASAASQDQENLVEAFRKVGLGFLVKTKVEASSVKSWILEQEHDHGRDVVLGPRGFLPEEVRDRIYVEETYVPVVLGAGQGVENVQ